MAGAAARWSSGRSGPAAMQETSSWAAAGIRRAGMFGRLSSELWSKVGDGVDQEGGISWG